MGLFDFLKKKKSESFAIEEPAKEIIPNKNEAPQSHSESPVREEPVKDVVVSAKKPELPNLFIGDFKVHDDIKNLLWFGDGPYKNLTKEQMASDKDVFVMMGGTRLGFRYGRKLSNILRKKKKTLLIRLFINRVMISL